MSSRNRHNYFGSSEPHEMQTSSPQPNNCSDLPFNEEDFLKRWKTRPATGQLDYSAAHEDGADSSSAAVLAKYFTIDFQERFHKRWKKNAAMCFCTSNPSQTLAQDPEMQFNFQALMWLRRKRGWVARFAKLQEILRAQMQYILRWTQYVFKLIIDHVKMSGYALPGPAVWSGSALQPDHLIRLPPSYELRS